MQIGLQKMKNQNLRGCELKVQMIIIRVKMAKILYFCVIAMMLEVISGQAETTYSQPSWAETNSFVIFNSSSPNNPLIKNITFQNAFIASSDLVLAVSLASFYTFPTLAQVLTLHSSILDISKSHFEYEYELRCLPVCNITLVEMMYLAVDYAEYQYLEVYEVSLPWNISSQLMNRYFQIAYLTPLDPTHDYTLNTVLAGFDQMIVVGQPFIQIEAIFQNYDTYLIQIELKNIVMTKMHLSRILIDNTIMNSYGNGLSSTYVQTGTIYLFSDSNIPTFNYDSDYLPRGLFFGMKQLTQNTLGLAEMSYIFNNTSPRKTLQIGYILFLEKSCPTNLLYVSTQNLCYSLSSAFYYQTSGQTLAKCPYSCYKCVGPLSTSCSSCVDGWNRVLVAGRCICIAGFYDPGSSICLNCTSAIAGCFTCSDAVNCITCLPGCTAINFTPIYCDCPQHINKTSQYNCPLTFYFDFDTNNCECLPEQYLSLSTNTCQDCGEGCYVCVNSSYCIQCLDMYDKIQNTCVLDRNSYALLGVLTTNPSSPLNRCIRWDKSNSVCLKTCKAYYYQWSCYPACPPGTFNISIPYKSCQLCKSSCILCFNYTVCYQCASNYYYFNKLTFGCSSCPQHCLKCNSSGCISCETHYAMLANGTCAYPTKIGLPCQANCMQCLTPTWCLMCANNYYLNKSSGVCLVCSPALGLKIASFYPICIEVCGDGLSINSPCDDNNSFNDDGCNSNCQVQTGYSCVKISSGLSQCGLITNYLTFQIFSYLNENSLLFKINSKTSISGSKIQLDCSFASNISTKTIITNFDVTIKLDYFENLLMAIDQNDVNRSNVIKSRKNRNKCDIYINSVYSASTNVIIYPQPLFIDHSSIINQVPASSLCSSFFTLAIYSIIALSITGISPFSSFVALRSITMSFIVLSDYYAQPGNTYPLLSSLTKMMFMFDSNLETTEAIIGYDDQFVKSVLWRVGVLYGVMIGLHEFVLKLVGKLLKKTNLEFMKLFADYLWEHRQITYQSTYLSYELMTFYFIVKICFQPNPHLVSTPTWLFLALHLSILVLAKIHAYQCIDQLRNLKNMGQFYFIFVGSSFQNIVLGVMANLSNEQVSYSSLLIIITSVYSLLAFRFNWHRPRQFIEDSLQVERPTAKSDTIACIQSLLCLCLTIICQLAKLANAHKNVWQGDAPTGAFVAGVIYNYCFLLMSIISSLGGVMAMAMTFYEVKVLEGQLEQHSEMATSEGKVSEN